MNQLAAVERRRRNLRIVFVIITLGTLPFYCAGILLYLSAPRTTNIISSTQTLRPGQATNTPLVVTTAPPGFVASNTPLGIVTIVVPPTQNPVVLPTAFFPTQFLPPTQFFPTSVIPPQPTLAPSLTPFPTATPFPTDPPIPTDTPIPTWTWTATPTPTDTATLEPTPIPFIEDTPIPPGP